MKYIYIYILIFFSTQSCVKNEKIQTESEILKEFIKSKNVVLSRYENIIIIPFNGCGECTKKVLKYFNTESSKKSLFIISEINRSDLKMLNLKFNKCLFDYDSELVSLGVLENKPLLYKINNEDLVFISKIDNSNVDKIILKI